VRGLLGIKALAGLGLGAMSIFVARGLAAWLSWEQAGLIGLSVALRIWAMGAFAVLLGLGQTGKWSVETTWRQVAVAVVTIALVRTPSLTLALVAVVLHEIVFLALGLWWVWGWMVEVRGQRSEVRSQKSEVRGQNLRLPTSDLPLPTSGLLRFGAAFSLANLALVVMFRISPITVEKLTGSHPEVGYFDLALGGLLLVYTFLGQVAYAFVPILTQLHLDGRAAEVETWLGRYVRYAALIAGLAAGGIWAIASPVTPLLFGPGFEPTASTLRAIAVGLLPLPIAWAAVIASAVEKRPAHKVRAALIGLGVFLIGAVILRGFASAGIALAFGLGLAGYAAGFGAGAGRAVRAGGIGWGVALAAAGLFAIFLFFPFDSLLAALAAWAGTALAYALVLLGLRAIRPDEIRQTVRALRR
jgi:O-antigen/teichoic acid export membrane protein